MTEAISIRSVMHAPAVVVTPDSTLAVASHVLSTHKVGAAVVLGADGAAIGILSERDLLRSVAEEHDPKSTTVAEAMTSNPVTIDADEPVAKALEIFRAGPFRHLPVLGDGKVLGILSIRHVVRVAQIEDVKPAGSAPQLAPSGLEGVAVAETAVGDVRGEEGFFHYRGYDASLLARTCSFEQVWHLLIEGELPNDEQLAAFRAKTVAARAIAPELAELLPKIAGASSRFVPLESLRTAVSLAAQTRNLEPTLDIDADRIKSDALALTALVPVMLMRLYRAHRGLPPVDPDPDLGYAAAYLQMLTGERPNPVYAKAVEKYLILTMDHGFNASTFTSRVITSTGSDLGSALVGAIGALAGPLHGGAPSRALAMLDAIGTPDKAEAYLRREIEAGNRLMGFGHRVYKTDDPRSMLLCEVAQEIGGEQAEFARHVEQTALRVLNELKPGRRLYTNVEFYAGVVMNTAGIPRDMFTPTFACSRTVGWAAAISEQAAHNRLIRPSAIYVGPAAPRPLPAGYHYA